MKKVKMIAKTLLFSAFMAAVVSKVGDTVSLVGNQSDNVISVCCEDCPDAESSDSGY